jgi:hypothetical protein
MAQRPTGDTNGKQKPLASFRCGKIKLAVWGNERTRQADGATVTTYNFTLTKSFKRDKDSSDWEEQKMSLFPDEAWQIQQVLAEAQREFCVRRDS